MLNLDSEKRDEIWTLKSRGTFLLTGVLCTQQSVRKDLKVVTPQSNPEISIMVAGKERIGQ